MIYFKTITLPSSSDPDVNESAIRNACIRKSVTPDISNSSFYERSDNKHFIGYEKDDRLLLSRIKPPVLWLQPKLIISFKKNQSFQSYRIRLSLLTSILFLVFSTILLLNIYYYFTEGYVESSLSTIILWFSLMILFIGIEIQVIKKRINKIISQWI